MRRLSELTLTILLITVCSTFSVTAEWKMVGDKGDDNPLVYGVVAINMPYIVWNDNGIPAYTITDHYFLVSSFAVRGCNYSYEFKQWLSEYDPVRGVVGNNINEIKNLGHGNLEPFDEDNNDQPDRGILNGWNCTVLAAQPLVDRDWYAFAGYTHLVVEGLRGTDDWKVESDMVTFQWRIPQD